MISLMIFDIFCTFHQFFFQIFLCFWWYLMFYHILDQFLHVLKIFFLICDQFFVLFNPHTTNFYKTVDNFQRFFSTHYVNFLHFLSILVNFSCKFRWFGEALENLLMNRFYKLRWSEKKLLQGHFYKNTN